jgi:hypothetical protein
MFGLRCSTLKVSGVVHVYKVIIGSTLHPSPKADVTGEKSGNRAKPEPINLDSVTKSKQSS